jgi:glutamate synthase (ferredoxin)
MSGRDVAIAALLGAEEFGFATAPLVCMGCMMMRVCSKDTCPAGIATQNKTLRKRFQGKPEHVMNFMRFIAQELREIMASLGFHTVEEMIGRIDCLKIKDELPVTRSRLADLSGILDQKYVKSSGNHFRKEDVYDFHLEKTKDEEILLPFLKEYAEGDRTQKAEITTEVSSTDRAFGTILGSEITKQFGSSLPEDSITVRACGGGGQSFGAFIPAGLTIRLKGDANDGFGKGLSGGKLVITPPDGAGYKAHDNIIIGNVALYGATSGTAYFAGIAGERFCVRNSGARAVCEGCGDHGLEYMTGGIAVILGETGKNFAAGMSGGVAYVLDEHHVLYRHISSGSLVLKEVSDKYDIHQLREILEDYYRETGSPRAKMILCNEEEWLPHFKKIIAAPYQAMVERISYYEEQGISRENAEMAAFSDLTRAAGGE